MSSRCQPKPGEDPVLHLHGLGRACRGVAGDLRRPRAGRRSPGPARSRRLLGAGPLEPAPRDLALHLAVLPNRERRRSRSIVTMNFSPGPSGFGSVTISSQPTTPGSELKMKSLRVSTFHSGRSPSASAEKTHSSPWRAISATGPCANGPIVCAQVHVEATWSSAGRLRISLTIGGRPSPSPRRARGPGSGSACRRRGSGPGSRSCPAQSGTPSIRACWRSCSIVLISPLWPSTVKG